MPHKRKSKSSRRPKIGQLVTLPSGKKARIFKVHPFGTVDVLTVDGERAFRLTGLPFV